jgi:hypothetical protein
MALYLRLRLWMLTFRQYEANRKTGVCSNPTLLASVSIWLCCLLLGMAILWNYALTPGVAAAAPGQWPSGSVLGPLHNRPRIVMVVHPMCSCSRASVNELAKIMAESRQKAEAFVVFVEPKTASKDWVETALWRSAATIPGVQLVRDAGGKEASRFDTASSGQTMFYDGEGHLIFSGGITPARGHEGDNPGHDAIVSYLNHGVGRYITSQVFGCSVQELRTDLNAGNKGAANAL